MIKWFSRIVLGLLVVSVGFLVYVNYKEAQVILMQRHLLIDMYQYIIRGCPPGQLQFGVLKP